MTRVLWVTSEPPDRGASGGSIRQSHLIEALGRRAEVELVMVGRLGDRRVSEVIAGLTELPEVTPDRPRTSALRRRMLAARYMLARYPAEVTASAPVRRRLAVEVAVRMPTANLVHLEHTELAPMLPAGDRPPFSLTMQQLISRRLQHEMELAPTRLQRFLTRRQLAKAARLEEWSVRHFDRVFVASAEDAAHLRGRAHQSPNGVDTEMFHPTPLPAAPRLVLTASLNWWPNVEGALWFVREVLPLVREQVPQTTLHVVGRKPVSAARELASVDGVALSADVPDIRPFLEEARVALVPIRIGSGTRLKALEAMACGRPVIGTSIGLEGLGITNWSEAVALDSPTDLAAAVVTVLRDDSVAVGLASRGRAHVEANFGWRHLGAAYAAAALAIARP